MTEINMSSETLDDLLRMRAGHLGDEPVHTFLVDGETKQVSITYAELHSQAMAIAATLAGRRGERAILLYPFGLEFVAAFFGCLYAGVVAVPVFPPDPSRLDRTLPRVQAIAKDSGAALVLTTRPLVAMAEHVLLPLAPDLAQLHWQSTDDAPAVFAGPLGLTPDDTALIQYTSGSTGTPKGVVLTHRQVLANQRMGVLATTGRRQDILLSWVPFYHDLGLFHGILHPVYRGGQGILMSPLHFLQRPMRWLENLSRLGAQASSAPNFALDLCVRRSLPEERAELDLSGWELAMIGAEPVRPDTLARFSEAFAPAGFRREAFFIGFGLAEAVLGVSGGPWRERAVNHLRLRDGIVAKGDTTLVAAGTPSPGNDVRIVHPETREQMGAGRVGEIWVRGPSVGSGYWNRPEQTESIFRATTSTGEGPFLRTGDLGFVSDGDVYVSGRLKDLIIVRGRNLFPQDLEWAVEQAHPDLRPGCSAAFGMLHDDREVVVVVAEVRRGASPSDVADAARAQLSDHFGVALHALVLIPPKSLPKTSSGKVRRSATREAWESGHLPVIKACTRSTSTRPTHVEVATFEGMETEAILRVIRTEVAAALNLRSPSDVPRNTPFAELGMDSAAGVGLAQRMRELSGIDLPETLVFEAPTPALLAAAVSERLSPGPISIEDDLSEDAIRRRLDELDRR